MRITGKIMEGVVDEVAGGDAIPLVRYLKNKKNISEFKIAQVLKAEVNTTRNMLYRLYDNNLVTFIRKKDKKKGWYIYYWTLNPKSVTHLTQSIRKRRLDGLRERLKREQKGNFYICPAKCMRLDFEQASNFNFKCLECGKLLLVDDNREVIENIRKELSQLEKKEDINIPAPAPVKVTKSIKKKKKTKAVKKAKKRKRR